MLQVKSLMNKKTIGSRSRKNVEIEFKALLLGMMTAFGLELSEKQIRQNIKTLFKQLRLPRRKGLESIIRNNLASLQSDGLIIRQEGRYKISEKGVPLGISTLKFFRQSLIN